MHNQNVGLTDPSARKGRRRGAAAVELAVTLPLFVLIMLGIIEFGRAMMVSETLTTAARLGARRAIVEGATNAQIEQSVRAFCSSTLRVAAEAIEITITVSTAAGNVPAGNEVARAQMGDLCTVDVRLPFDKVALFTPGYLAAQSLSGSCAMEHE